MMASILLTAAEADLVRAAGEMCPTCHGRGTHPATGTDHGPGVGFRPGPCPNCSGKRPGVVTLTVEGEPCRGSRTSCPPFTRAMCRYGGNHHPPSRWAFDGQRVTLTEHCRGSRFCRDGGPCTFCGAEFGPDECVLQEGYWYLPTHIVPLATATVRVEPGDGTHWNVVLDEIEVAG